MKTLLTIIFTILIVGAVLVVVGVVLRLVVGLILVIVGSVQRVLKLRRVK